MTFLKNVYANNSCRLLNATKSYITANLESWHFIRQQLLWLNSQPIFVAFWIMETLSSEFSSILQKRFDTVDHGFSLHKLRRYRIQWYANDFLRCCLTNRTQHTYANGVRSDVQSSICGVYQGSVLALHWRHNEPDGVLNHQPRDCLLNCLFRFRSKKTSKLRVTGLCAENSPGTGEFSAQRASYAENVSIWWRHHGTLFLCYIHKCSNRLSYQCQAFPAHCFWVLALVVWIYFLVKLSFEMLTFLTHERMFLGKVSKVYRQKMSQPEEDSNPQTSNSCRILWSLELSDILCPIFWILGLAEYTLMQLSTLFGAGLANKWRFSNSVSLVITSRRLLCCVSQVHLT